ncbi:MAG: peptidoglycan-binding protein [Myxococcota bacterium]|nr:peptidoglycan-binding protein [Myxococcota bacterium]
MPEQATQDRQQVAPDLAPAPATQASPVAAQAAQGQENQVLGEAKVTARSLNVRSVPSTRNNSPIGGVKRGQTLEVLGHQGDWLKVRYKGKTAYIHGAYATFTEAPKAEPVSAPPAPEAVAPAAPTPEAPPAPAGSANQTPAEEIAAVAQGRNEEEASTPEAANEVQAPAEEQDGPKKAEPAAPASPPAPDAQAKDAQPGADALKVSKGQMTFNVEGNDDELSASFSRRASVPAPGSGVTIGRGFDLAHSGLNEEKTKELLIQAGVSEADAAALAKGVGITDYEKAKEFAYNHRHIILTHEQQKAIFSWQYEDKKSYAAGRINAWTGTDLNACSEPMQELLVDLFFRGDMTKSKWNANGFAAIVEKNDLSGMLTKLGQRGLWSNVDDNRFAVRQTYARDANAGTLASSSAVAVAAPVVSTPRPAFDPLGAAKYNKGLSLTKAQWKSIQTAVGALPADGRPGMRTAAKVYDFQVAKGMKDPDGKAGPNTRKVIETGVVPDELKAPPAPTPEPAAPAPAEPAPAPAEPAPAPAEPAPAPAEPAPAPVPATPVPAEPEPEEPTKEEGKEEEKEENLEPQVASGHAAGDPLLDDAQVTAAIAWNNGKELRIDFVRKMQLALGIPSASLSNNGDVDATTVQAIARFQVAEGLGDPDGKVGPKTRAALMTTYESLKDKLIGDNTEERVMVPGTASEAERYEYYKKIIAAAGGAFKEGHMEVNLIGIRGALITGENGSLEIKQSSSAGDYKDATDKGEEHLHFYASSARDEVFDDAIITVWRSIDENGKATLHVGERKGTVDPASGTAHLKDGQYEYGIGTHGTTSSNHINIAKQLARDNDSISVSQSGDKTRYTALRGQRDIEVWRDTNKDGFLSDAELETSQTAINKRQSNYVDEDSIAINIHTSSNTSAYSAGCTNVPNAHYGAFMDQIQDASNKSSIYYTVIDASKIDLVITKQEEQPKQDGQQ